jgi:dihydroflavonol-4-reductase
MEKVLVTGASGFIAEHCIIELLKNGYSVKGSLRTMSREQEVREAVKTETDDAKLEFCKLDLLDDDGWEEAMRDCDYLMHVASPFVIEDPKDENELIKPAKEGTLRALNAAKKAGIKRVVLTSSVAAVNSHMMSGTSDHTTWTDINSKYVTPYQKSKTIAEKAAWDFYNNQDNSNKMEMAVINPGGVMGPQLGNDLGGASTQIVSQLISGKFPMIPALSFPFIDVRDVAILHLKAMTTPEADGKRFIAAHSEPTWMYQVAEVLSAAGYEKIKLKKAPSFMLKLIGLFDNKTKSLVPMLDKYVPCDNSQTVKILNWEPMPWEQAFIEHAKSIEAIKNNA